MDAAGDAAGDGAVGVAGVGVVGVDVVGVVGVGVVGVGGGGTCVEEWRCCLNCQNHCHCHQCIA